MARPLRAVIALLAVLVATVGLAPTASAHTWEVTPACDGLTVDLQNYNDSGPNTLTVVVKDEVVVDAEDFGSARSETFAFDPLRVGGTTWSVDVVAHDGGEWSFTEYGTEQPCPTPAEPTIACADSGMLVTVTPVEGVVYSVRDAVVESTYPVEVAEGEGYSVTVVATLAAPEVRVAAAATSLDSWTFEGVRECEDEPVTPVEPTVSVECADEGMLLTVPETEGVEYIHSGEVVPAGEHKLPLAEGDSYDVTVTAEATEGHVIADDAETSFTFAGTRECEAAPEPEPAPTPELTPEAPTPSESVESAPVAPVDDDTKPAAVTLPRTGSQVGLLAGVAAVVLAVGAGMVLVARRRSV